VPIALWWPANGNIYEKNKIFTAVAMVCSPFCSKQREKREKKKESITQNKLAHSVTIL
jgi:hypothetical protein